MRPTVLACATAALLTLSGCGGTAEAPVANKTANYGPAWPAEAPAYLPAYPGAMMGNFKPGTGATAAGATITFTTSDAPEKVVEFYKSRAEGAGYKQVSDNSTDSAGAKNRIVALEDKGTKRSMSIFTNASQGMTSVSLIFSGEKAK
ncbi:hypothetical protein ACFQ1E_11130 [Sphingomonas canadensis]|uniref:Lipoprotein n=1 Tax=Sphingomonas canadensis TaxID=1219257 RepID=A0ABW3H812_9SPHN|nr:hypothetical protein [Sphingomonas canadensis]MCW3836327.1 hypothetical protein [Sphingomonas canadensis]